MSPRVIPFLRNAHRDVRALLPWYVNGALDPSEREAVRLHLVACADCRDELAEVRETASAYVGIEGRDAAPNVEEGWADLSRQLDRNAALRAKDRRRNARRDGWDRLATPRGLGWLGLTAAAQFAVIVVLCGMLWLHPSPRYHTLSAKPAAAANLVVIFQPDAREKALRQLLRASAARLVDGPSAADAYMLRVPSATRAQALEVLRRSPEVVLAEPVDGG